MKNGVIICGLNGAGKSTLGRALAAELGWRFVDAEELYFPNNDGQHPYAGQRSFEEAQAVLRCIMAENENIILASVKGNYGSKIISRFTHVVYVAVPKQVRYQRLCDRSYAKFGQRMCSGGDLYEQEKAFLDFAMARDEQTVESWLATLNCPLTRVDGTLPIEITVKQLVQLFGADI